MYKIKMLWCCLFALSVVALRAQETAFDYQLIFESQGQYNNLDKHSVINPDNRMNVEELTSLTRLYPVLKFRYAQNDLSATLQTEGNLSNYNFSGDSVRFSFQELYVRFAYQERHHITLGKRRLDWGSGMIWNPTNFYVQKDPFRTQNRLEGIFQVAYSYLFSGGTLQAYLFPEKRLKDFSYGLKYDYYGTRLDASLSFLQYTRYQQFGYSLSYGGNISTLYAEGVFRNSSKSYRVGKEGELLPPTEDRKKFRTEAVVGFSLNCNAHISLRGEYRFREDYLNRTEVKQFEDALPSHTLIYDAISVGKHSLFGSAEWKDLYDQYFIQMRSFYDPTSNQLILSPLLIRKINNFQIELSMLFNNNALAVFNYQGSIVLSCHF